MRAPGDARRGRAATPSVRRSGRARAGRVAAEAGGRPTERCRGAGLGDGRGGCVVSAGSSWCGACPAYSSGDRGLGRTPRLSVLSCAPEGDATPWASDHIVPGAPGVQCKSRCVCRGRGGCLETSAETLGPRRGEDARGSARQVGPGPPSGQSLDLCPQWTPHPLAFNHQTSTSHFPLVLRIVM